MRPYHDHPESVCSRRRHEAVFNDENLSYRLQSAFILNLQNHWLPIRRFSSPNRWYNLNSFLDAPQWISPTFLAMVLTQAEEEGYNVFVVRPLDSTALGDAENGTTSALPESQADLLALELGEPDGRSGGGVSNISTGEYISFYCQRL
jgi:ataxin-3